MNSRYLQTLGIYMVADLMNREHLQELALKIAKTLKGIVLDEDTINPKELPLKERRLYREWRNPRKWKAAKGSTSSTQRNIARKFRAIVEQHGQRKIYSTLDQAVKSKILQLSQNPKLAVFLPNYTWKVNTKEIAKSLE